MFLTDAQSPPPDAAAPPARRRRRGRGPGFSACGGRTGDIFHTDAVPSLRRDRLCSRSVFHYKKQFPMNKKGWHYLNKKGWHCHPKTVNSVVSSFQIPLRDRFPSASAPRQSAPVFFPAFFPAADSIWFPQNAPDTSPGISGTHRRDLPEN